MPKARLVYVPEAAQGRLTFLGQEIPIRVEDVASDARQPGTRVRFDLVWEDEDLRASNVRRAWGRGARERRIGQQRRHVPVVPSGTDLRNSRFPVPGKPDPLLRGTEWGRVSDRSERG